MQPEMEEICVFADGATRSLTRYVQAGVAAAVVMAAIFLYAHAYAHGPLVPRLAPVRVLAAQESHEMKSVWDGVYTETQAGRGATLYEKECAKCHAPGTPPAPGQPAGSGLAGEQFLMIWDGRTAQDIYQVMKNTMPQDGPGKIDRRGYADVLAFIFKANGFPAGAADLKPDPELLKLIRIEKKVESKGSK